MKPFMPHRFHCARAVSGAAVVAWLMICGGTSPPASAATGLTATARFDISPQRLPAALLRYSQQSSVQVTSPAELIADRDSPGVKGELTAERALTELLSGTGLEFAIVDDTTVAIHVHRGGNASSENTRAQWPLAQKVADVHLAQASDRPNTVQSLPAAGNGSTGAPADAEAPTLQEVIVTAQKRSENILSVPISITAVNEAVLDQRGVKDIDDLSRLVPGVSLITPAVATTPQSTGVRVISIRGISATAGSATTGVYVDDTPIQGRESGSVYPEIFDLDRVEVLRGPQGTLFGAGSEGGTVRFITPQPSLTRSSFYSRGEMAFTRSGTPSYEAGAAGGGPLVEDRLGLRASIWARQDGGYINRYNFFTNNQIATNTNSIDSYAGRVALLAKPVDSVTITPSLLYQRVDRADSDVWWSTAGLYKSFYDIPQPTTEQFYLPSLSIEWQLPGVSIKSISSFFTREEIGINRFFHSSKQQLFYPQVPDYSLADHITKTQNNFTQELRFTSDADQPFTWVAGLYFLNGRESYREYEYEPLADQLWLALTGFDINDFFGVPLIDGAISYRDDRHDRERESAAFADVSYNFTQRLNVSAGVRVSRTEFSFNETSDGAFGVGADLLPVVSSGSSSEHPVTPKASISYDLGNGVLYGSARKGYRIGGANALLPNICDDQLRSLGINGQAPPYTSDTVWSYEVGAKDALAGGRVQLAASAFRINWSRIQGVIPLDQCAYTFTGNFGTAVSQGADLQFLLTLLRGLEISGSVAFTDAHYTETVQVRGNTTQLLAKDGDPLLSTPRWQGDLSLSYTWSLDNGSEMYARADSTYSGRYFRTYSQGVNGYIAAIRDGASIVDVSLRTGVRFHSWDVSAFVKNLTDNATPLYEDVGTRPGTYGATAIRSISMRPRTLGVTATYRY
jgi:iron complex outermembrane recepter protein